MKSNISLKTTLVICTYMRPGCIERLLEYLSGMENCCDELIIVDASMDKLTEKIVSRYLDGKYTIKYIHSEKGLTLQRNIGLEIATGNLVGFFDDDIIPDPDFFTRVRKVFEQESDVFGVAPYIYESNQNVLTGLKGRYFRWLMNFCGVNYFARVLGKVNMAGGVFSGIVEDIITNGCTIYRREVFQEFTFADWMQGYCYGEDLEFGLRVSSKYRVIGSGDLRLHHYHESSGRDNDFLVYKMKAYNFLRILKNSGKASLFCRAGYALRLSMTIVFASMVCLCRLQILSGLAMLAGNSVGIFYSIVESCCQSGKK